LPVKSTSILADAANAGAHTAKHPERQHHPTKPYLAANPISELYLALFSFYYL
jgi:hypothetical protein